MHAMDTNIANEYPIMKILQSMWDSDGDDFMEVDDFGKESQQGDGHYSPLA